MQAEFFTGESTKSMHYNTTLSYIFLRVNFILPY